MLRASTDLPTMIENTDLFMKNIVTSMREMAREIEKLKTDSIVLKEHLTSIEISANRERTVVWKVLIIECQRFFTS